MKVKTTAEMKLRIEEIYEDPNMTQEEFEQRAKQIEESSVEDLEEAIKESLCVDDAKILSCEIKSEIMEE